MSRGVPGDSTSDLSNKDRSGVLNAALPWDLETSVLGPALTGVLGLLGDGWREVEGHGNGGNAGGYVLAF